jgi:hypothetical protein
VAVLARSDGDAFDARAVRKLVDLIAKLARGAGKEILGGCIRHMPTCQLIDKRSHVAVVDASSLLKTDTRKGGK